MINIKRFTLPFLLGCLLVWSGSSAVHSQSATSEVLVLDHRGNPLDHLTDGDAIRLRIILTGDVEQPTPVTFNLAGLDTPLAGCTVERGSNRCQSEPLDALGWRWNPGGIVVQERIVEARSNGTVLATSTALPVAPRPVIMVHGFSSSWEAWERYLGAGGYLASIGIPAYAVGDGQFEGVLNTGRIDQPTGKTNTIAQNAAILGSYIEAVKQHTGAQKVDLLGHSMGGLISRYYIDRLMNGESVGQLIMLGSPMAGSDCANLPASLGYYLPAVLEIRPSYILRVFNPQITKRHGVPFHALAGVPILEALKSPCTPVPSDLAVALKSVGAIPLHLSQLPVLHTDLNTSREVFDRYVRPLLQASPGTIAFEPDPPKAPAQLDQPQFTRAFSGHLEPSSSQELTIYIDPGVAVASFALFDPTRSLDVVVRGASGNVIELDPDANGLTVVDDPQMLFQLGYGFNNPRPGAWKVTLVTTEDTPASGADFALTASFIGGAQLTTEVTPFLSLVGDTVQITARLTELGQPLEVTDSQVDILQPDGDLVSLPMILAGAVYQASWKPPVPGLYGVEVRLSGLARDGSNVERAASFTLETQPESRPQLLGWTILIIVCLSIIAINAWVLALLINRNRKIKQAALES